MATTKKAKIPVLVTTEHRGVFFGYISKEIKKIPNEMTLEDARNCIYWSQDVKGFLGLASGGPTTSCKVGPKAISLTIKNITSVTQCSKQAQKAWESEPWK